MGNYWDLRYKSGGKIWGDNPSISVIKAEKIFSSNAAHEIHIPGCGYGRNAGYFIEKGYSVSGSEISETACVLAGKLHPELKIENRDMLNRKGTPDTADALYAYNVFHLFHENKRRQLSALWGESVREGGIIFCTVFSELETSFSKGKETEPNTFESKPGRPVHYFTEYDLMEHFAGLAVLDIGMFDEHENHEGEHVHKLRYLIAKRRNK